MHTWPSSPVDEPGILATHQALLPLLGQMLISLRSLHGRELLAEPTRLISLERQAYGVIVGLRSEQELHLLPLCRALSGGLNCRTAESEELILRFEGRPEVG